MPLVPQYDWSKLGKVDKPKHDIAYSFKKPVKVKQHKKNKLIDKYLISTVRDFNKHLKDILGED
jgi:hypothetical protein